MFFIIESSAAALISREVANEQIEPVGGTDTCRVWLSEEQAEQLSGEGFKLAAVSENCFTY